jgi:hypothetical protein
MYKEISEKSNYIAKWFNTYNIDSWEDWDGFGAYSLDDQQQQLIDNDNVLKKLNNVCKIKKLAILKMEPDTFYPPHIDRYKKCKVNMLLTTSHTSHCCFLNKDQTTIVQVPYKKNTMYILNTNNLHMIINFNKPRYLFSVMFDNDLTYKGLAKRV